MFRNESVRTIVQRLETCSSSSVSWTVFENKEGDRLIVRPAAEGLCPFELEFGPPDSYNVNLGYGVQLENMKVAEVDPVAVADAIMLGRVDERVWFLFGKIPLGARGSVRLGDGRVLTDEECGSFFLASLAAEKTVDYRPYPLRAEPPWQRR